MNDPRGTSLPAQGDLFALHPDRSPAELLQALSRPSRRPVHLTLTRNRSSMVSLTQRGHDLPVKLRLHEAFLQAPDEVIQSLARYLKRARRSDWKVVEDFAQTIRPNREAGRALPRLRTHGAVYDLGALADKVNREFFQGRLRCRVGWSPARPRRTRTRRRRASIRYGSYHRDSDTIRIHPLLDDASVPETFVEYVIYHEMLHAVVPPERRNGRTMYHPPAFRHLERQFPDWTGMQNLGKELLDRLG